MSLKRSKRQPMPVRKLTYDDMGNPSILTDRRGRVPEQNRVPVADRAPVADQVPVADHVPVADQVPVADRVPERPISTRSIAASRTSRATSISSRASRKKIEEIEFHGQQELERMEFERRLEFDKKQYAAKIQHQKRMVELDAEDDEKLSQKLDSDEEVVDEARSAQTRLTYPINNCQYPTRSNAASVQNWISQVEPTPPSPSPAQDKDSMLIKLMDNQMKLLSKSSDRSKFDRDLPFFSGEPSAWPVFYGEWSRTNDKFEEVENIRRLQKCLKGVARDAVSGLLDEPKNVDRIVEILRRRFGRPELIIDHLVEKVKNAKPPELGKPETFIEFGTLVQHLVARIEALNEIGYLYDKSLLTSLVRKLPVQSAEEWIQWIELRPSFPKNLSTFHLWLDGKVKIYEQMYIPVIRDVQDKKDKFHRFKNNVAAVAEPTKESRRKCQLCSSADHAKIEVCPKFKKMNLDQRWIAVKQHRLCFICLYSNHSVKDCRKKKECGTNGCKLFHHVLLHPDKKTKQAAVSTSVDFEGGSESEEEPGDQVEVNTKIVSSAITSASLPIMPVRVTGPKGTIIVNALLDSGANVNLIEEDVVKQIGVDGTPQSFSFTVYGNDVREESSSEIVQLELSGCFRRAPSYWLAGVRTVKKLGIPGITLNVEELKTKYPYLRKCKAKSLNRAIPKMIIGWKASRLFAHREILEDPTCNSPVAFRCLLGWYLCVNEEGKDVCSVSVFHAQNEDNLELLVRDHFSLENMGVVLSESDRSVEDKRALVQMEQLTTRQTKNRWETGLPWKDPECVLPDSKRMALRRLYVMERKMDKDVEFAHLCEAKFEDYINKGYLVPVEPTLERKAKEWFLPWFFAYHPTKSPRLVFDAAAKHSTIEGKSLNDFLLKGPDLLRPLPSVLMRFRRHQIVITGDIREMFHQVALRKDDRSAQKILFRGMERKKAPQEYEMSVLFFGSASSPSSAIYVKNLNAKEMEAKYPNAVRTILLDEYMDDHLSGAETVEDAIRLRSEVTEIHSNGGFPIVKWNSNSKEVIQSIPEGIRQPGATSFCEKGEVEVEKTLGLLWDPSEDEFKFKLSLKKVPLEVKNGVRAPTKREILSIVMSVFDPLGFLAPLKMKATRIIQETWRSKLRWEDTLEGDIWDEWKSWLNLLRSVQDVSIRRKFSTLPISGSTSNQLHVFCDASDEAFAAAVYLRTEVKGKIEVSFVFGKSRVAPLRGQTIPRLELQAAVLGTRLLKFIEEAFQNELRIDQVIYWSDSRTVLCQIRSETCRFKSFVSNRINEILASSKPENWRWIPTNENVADDATRSHKVEPIRSNMRWLSGPSFLCLPEENWPKETTALTSIAPVEMEVKSVNVTVQREISYFEVLPKVERFSNWIRLIRASATVRRAYRRFKRIQPYEITAEDREWAKTNWIKLVQKESFENELIDLENSNTVDVKSRLFNLSPQISSEGIIVLGGRINQANVNDNVKRPPILPSKHLYVKLLINYFHLRSGHFGQERVINLLRQHAWIIDCRTAVRRAWAECIECKLRKINPIPPEMGQLPYARLNGEAPFSYTGVDLFGLYNVAVNRSRQKRWGCLFTCMTTRAVHLELVESLEANDLINTYVRFINVRGIPTEMWSDNGTNFVGASKELKQSLQNWNTKIAPTVFLGKEISWKFIPPATPHMGGVWERLVGCVKKILDCLLKERCPREGVLRTIFSEVMAILNSRPLTRASPDPEDLECLTPNHFLILKGNMRPSVLDDYSDGEPFRKSWRFVQFLADAFWKRFQNEYIPTLAKRQKWFKKTTNLQPGDVVLVVDDQTPRNYWKRGVVTEAFVARDGQVRSVEVKVVTVDPDDPKKTVKISFLKRPVVKTCPLPVRKD